MTSATDVFAHEFDELEEGAGFRTSGRTITESDLVSFAALTGDRHPVHTDAQWAAGSRFGERVAHGMLVLSYALGLVPFDPTRVVALRGVDGAVFMRPAYIGDTIRVDGRIERLEPVDDDVGLVTCRWRVVNERDETVARAKLKVLWRRSEQNPASPRPQPDRRAREPSARDTARPSGSLAEQAIGSGVGEVYL